MIASLRFNLPLPIRYLINMSFKMKQTFLLFLLFFTFLNISLVEAQKIPDTAETKDTAKAKATAVNIPVDSLETGALEQLSTSTQNSLDEKKKDVSNTTLKSQQALLEKDAAQNKVDDVEKQLEQTKQEIKNNSAQKTKAEIQELKKKSQELEKQHNNLKIELKKKNEKAKQAYKKTTKQQSEIELLKKQLHQLDVEQNKRASPRKKAMSMSLLILIALITIFIKDKFSGFIEKRLIVRSERKVSNHSLRALTILRIINWSVSVFIVAITIFFILEIFGFDSTHTLAGAGMLGMAVGFGAQQFIKDIFSGLFLVFEGQYGVNDFIAVDNHSGNVEDINLRFTKLRNYDGNIIYIPNGDITTVVNYGKIYANAVINFHIDVHEDIDKVFALIREIVSELRGAPDLVDEILSDVQLLGINAFTTTGVEVKFRLKTAPQSQWLVGREVRLALKHRFDLEGIKLFQFNDETQWLKSKNS